MATHTSTRRGILGAMAIAPIVIIAPAAAAAGSHAFERLLAADVVAKARFNSLPADLESTDERRFQAEVDRMIAASMHADEAVPTTWAEFARWVEHVSDEGHSSIGDANQTRLLDHVRRLAG